MHGYVEPGFERVEAVFNRILERPGELGAAFAATVNGRPVIDVWGGVADAATGEDWTSQTAVVVFSGTKGLVALCLLMVADRGLVDLDAPVRRYWPEFAAHNKKDVRVVELAAHLARLPGIRRALGEDDILDDRRMASLLADQPQEADPRAAGAYHPLTYGWLCGEIVRRVDGRSVGEFFADEVAKPLDLDIWIGLPADREVPVAKLAYAETWGQRAHTDPVVLAQDELLRRVWANPPLFPPDHIPWNRSAFHLAEIPGAGAIGTARSLARLYGCLACGGEVDGVRLLSEAMLRRGRVEVTRRWDQLVSEPVAFGIGFQLQTEWKWFGPPLDAFGHGGAGGSIHCAWPSQAVGVSYAMNVMRDEEDVDSRPMSLLAELYAALARQGVS